MARTAISAKSGLRSEPLVKLPALKRKRARQFVNFLIGFFVFFLIGWGSYVIAKRVIQPPASLNTPSYNAEPSSSELPTASQPAASPIEESPTTNPSTSPTPSPSSTPIGDSVTIKDTETGYLNVREGASTATKIITTVDPGTTYPLLDTSTNGDWYKIELDDGNAGWISTKYAEKKSAE
jgi:cytoskeletal protein RodZ